jgi:hypothetical protein
MTSAGRSAQGHGEMATIGSEGGRILRLGVLAWGLFVFTVPSMADDWKFGGHAKYQYSYTDYRADDLNAVYGGDPARDHGLDLRLKAEKRKDAWDFAAHFEVLGVAGDGLETRRRLAAAGLPLTGNVTGLPNDSRRLFGLTHQFIDRPRAAAVERLDRLSVGYTTSTAVVRFGRQAVSWGDGLVFQVLDFVNPFSPLAIDKDYKTGDDMLYGQWSPGETTEVSAIVLPRRDPLTHRVESGQSSSALKLHARLEQFDVSLLAARHYGENVLGVGVVKSVGGAVWRLDASRTALDAGGGATSLVTNLDYSWTWFAKNVYGYLEYYRNGFGETERADYATPGLELAVRIARGEVFTLARDYAALGLQVELTPLFNLYSNVVWNLNDASRYLQVRGVYDWLENVQLMAGVNLPSGARGSEFGGIAVPLTGAYAGTGRSAYARIAYYF